MKAWGGEGAFPKKCPNPFSKRLQLLVLMHGNCCSDQMLASQKEIPLLFFYFVGFKHRHVSISGSDSFENFLEHLLQDGKCWCETQGFGVPFVLGLGHSLLVFCL